MKLYFLLNTVSLISYNIFNYIIHYLMFYKRLYIVPHCVSQKYQIYITFLVSYAVKYILYYCGTK